MFEIVFVLLYFEWKLSKTHASLSNSMQFWDYWRFRQIRQRINCTNMQIKHFIPDKILKLLRYHTLSVIIHCKVIWSQNSPGVFSPPCRTSGLLLKDLRYISRHCVHLAYPTFKSGMQRILRITGLFSCFPASCQKFIKKTCIRNSSVDFSDKHCILQLNRMGLE